MSNSTFSGERDFQNHAKALQGGDDQNEDMVVGGYRWGQVQQKKMICNLACAPGFIPVQES